MTWAFNGDGGESRGYVEMDASAPSTLGSAVSPSVTIFTEELCATSW